MFKGPGLWNTVPHTRRKPSLWPRSCHWPFKLWITEVTKGERCLALCYHIFFPKGKTMTKGNPLWETSYHSRVTIQRKKKKKKSSWNWATSPGKRTTRNLTGALFCSPNWSYLEGSHGHRYWVKLPSRGHIHSQDTHQNVFESRTSLCARAPPWKGSVTSGDAETSTRVPTRHYYENTHKCGAGITLFTFLPHAIHQQEIPENQPSTQQCWPGGSFPWLSSASTQNSNQETSLAV